MKKLLTLIFLFISFASFAQNKEVKSLLNSIEGKWSLNDKNELEYSKIIELPNALQDDIFQKAKNYFVYNYASAKDVIQTEVRDKGFIIGRGYWENLHIGANLLTYYISAFHYLRIDTKDGKARITITVSTYNERIVSSQSTQVYDVPIAKEFPINSDGMYKNIFGNAFYKLHSLCDRTISDVASALMKNDDAIEKNNAW